MMNSSQSNFAQFVSVLLSAVGLMSTSPVFAEPPARSLVEGPPDAYVGASSTSIAMRAPDDPHLCYMGYKGDDSPTALTYAFWNPVRGDWELKDLEQFGSACSIALDSNGMPHMSFFDARTGVIKYVTKDQTEPDGWDRDTVDDHPPNGGAMWTSIAVGANRTPHIAYYLKGDLAYARKKNDGTWSVEIVDAGPADVGMYVSMALDAHGAPHVSYYDRTHGTIKYAAKEPSGWNLDTVDDDPRSGNQKGWTSIAVDSSGTPHVAYYDNREKSLRYSKKVGTLWSTARQTLDSSGDVGTHNSIAVDAQGKPHIAYLDETNQKLKYATLSVFGGWSIGTVPTGRWAVVGYTDIAIDSTSRPYLSYIRFVRIGTFEGAPGVWYAAGERLPGGSGS